MTIDKEKLKALAEASEEWSEEIGEREWYAEGTFKKPFFSPCDAKFISSTSPAAILALLAEIEGLHTQHDRDSGELRKLCSARDSARRQRDQLKAENEDLRKALGDLLSLYEDDEGCRSLPEYIAGRAAMAKEASHG